ncbi:hypothetical protein [Nocardioides sp. AE5]|uniref:hypothetical protein n=1 Tax=Nocardioides sp. AE5 TaxID=2962573 RepID=UPI0028822111|nr:hypothetical protein [Nocardioides sp. AE5]MDT0203783.1 hypothetical protein [Nocardioides sp. AE5]
MPGPCSLRRSVPAAVAALGLALALAGCGTEDGTPTGGEPSSTPSQAPSAAPETGDDASETPAAPPSGPAVEQASDLLLSAEAMPGLNEQTTWSEASGASDVEPLGACQKASLTDIGAQDVESVSYTAGDATATQVVASLADTKSAEQLRDVLLSWHQDCATTITADESEVGDLLPVESTHGTAEAYVAHFSDPALADAHVWQGVAINTHDTWVSLVVIESQGMDYNYEDGQTPAERAAAAVAARIG